MNTKTKRTDTAIIEGELGVGANSLVVYVPFYREDGKYAIGFLPEFNAPGIQQVDLGKLDGHKVRITIEAI